MVSLLVEFNANVSLTGDDSTPALSYAAQQGHIEILRMLLTKKAKVLIWLILSVLSHGKVTANPRVKVGDNVVMILHSIECIPNMINICL